mgnify:CR=1 FL=1
MEEETKRLEAQHKIEEKAKKEADATYSPAPFTRPVPVLTRDFRVNLRVRENFAQEDKKDEFNRYLLSLCVDRRMYISPSTRRRIMESFANATGTGETKFLKDYKELQALEAKRRDSRLSVGERAKLEKDLGRVRRNLAKSEGVLQANMKEAISKKIPKGIRHSPHNAMRSVIGYYLPDRSVFGDLNRHYLGLDNGNMVDYAEFYVAEWLEERGLKIADPGQLVLSKPKKGEPDYSVRLVKYVETLSFMAKVRNAIYGTHAGSFREFLAKIAKPGQEGALMAEYDAQKAAFKDGGVAKAGKAPAAGPAEGRRKDKEALRDSVTHLSDGATQLVKESVASCPPVEVPLAVDTGPESCVSHKDSVWGAVSKGMKAALKAVKKKCGMAPREAAAWAETDLFRPGSCMNPLGLPPGEAVADLVRPVGAGLEIPSCPLFHPEARTADDIANLEAVALVLERGCVNADCLVR